MDTNSFDRLSRLFGMLGTRRSALGTLLCVAALRAASETDAVKGPPDAKRTRRGKKQREGHHRARAQAKTKPANHCIGVNGIDLNEVYGISAQIVTGFCPEVESGERWITGSGLWFVNDSFDAVPERFVQAGATPLEDFQAKFTALKLVIDAGTRQERTVVFPNEGNLFTGPADIFPGNPADWFVVTPVTLGTVQPLSVGDHVVQVYWVFSAMHCDGVAAIVEENC